jgi:hypothetical protein
MKPIRFAAVLFGLSLACANLLYAQAPAATSAPTGPAPNLSQLNVATMLHQMQAAAAEGSADLPAPLQIVVQFLQLRADQQTVFGELLQARQTAAAPLFQGIAQREQQLQALFASGGNPAQFGILVIQIHALQQQILQTQQVFLTNFVKLLDPDQEQRFTAVHVAAQLQPVVPAFQLLQLL